MPASPSLRYSPTRGKPMVRHRSELSMDDVFPSEENLELFSELQQREKEDFLIHFPDDFDKTFSSKLKNLSDVNVGTAVQGEGSELLNVDEEKHDYDWLMTPPETPLFPALDDETPANVVARGRPRTQPVSISRSSTMDKSCRSSRGSPSPNRLSHSPRSATSSTSQSRGRPSLSPSSSQRSVTPFRGPSSPKRTPSPSPRSSTPSSRRIGSTHGTSPIRSTRNSPKGKAWQPNILGFSSEAPPNLRTSLADRPGSYCRGSSPARNSKEIGHRRKSTSPASRELQVGDMVSSPALRSLDVRSDDDLNTAHANDRMSSKKPVVSQGNRSPLKKANKTFSAGSLPKRSFESPTRQTEYKKTPPNMFRPLLSSAPTSTLYGSKAYSPHYLTTPATAGNNSLPLRSEISEDDQHFNVDKNLVTETPNNEQNSVSETHIFSMESKENEEHPLHQQGIGLDPATRTSNHEPNIHCLEMDSKGNEEQQHHETSVDPVVETSNQELISLVQTHTLDSEEFDKIDNASPAEGTSIEGLNSHAENKDDISEETVIISEEKNIAELCDSGDLDFLQSCIKCGKTYPSAEFLEEVNLCIICYQNEGSQRAISCNPLAKEFSSKEIAQDAATVPNDCKSEEILSGRETISSPSPSSRSHTQEASLFNERKPEGVSVLFKSANTVRRDMFQSRSFSSTITYDDLVYAREGARSSVGTSASSSADFAPRSLHKQARAKQTDLSSSKHKVQMEDIFVPLEDADEAPSVETNHLRDATVMASCNEPLENCVANESCDGNDITNCYSAAEIEHKSLPAEGAKSCIEEDSETVLFCKSLVNDLVYHAAALAGEMESSVLTENSRAGLTFADRSNVGKGTKFEGKSKGESKAQLSNPKRMSFEEKVKICGGENDENANEEIANKQTSQNVGTPKIESKCYCTVM